MLRLLTTLPLPRSSVTELQISGYTYCDDIYSPHGGPRRDSKIQAIFQQYGATAPDVAQMMKPPPTVSALQILQDECSHPGIETFSKVLDEFLDGGVPSQMITELCGAPGSGKTQMCLQLCVDVQIPQAFDGVEGKAVYFNTSSGFSLSRLKELAQACVDHCSKIAKTSGKEELIVASRTFTKESILKNVFYEYCPSDVQLIAGVKCLKDLVEKEQVKLIVIDSVSFVFNTIKCSRLRVRLLYDLFADLQSLAHLHHIAVVVTNSLTTRCEPGKDSTLVPALGESFGHRVSLRFMLGRVDEATYAAIPLKNLTKQPLMLAFQISQVGVRDCRHPL